MCRTIFLIAAASLWTGIAAGQQPTLEVQPDRIELPSVAPPAVETPPIAPLAIEPPRPDTTLLDDTDASGLKPRLKDEAPEETQEGKELQLPVGRRCTVLTEQGQSFSGRLEVSGVWFVLRPEGQQGRKIWVASRYVVAILEMDQGEPQAEATPEADKETPKPEQGAAQAFRRQVAELERELAAMQERLARAVEEADHARREAQSQRDLTEQLRQRADEARRAAEKELRNLLEQLKKATQDAPE